MSDITRESVEAAIKGYVDPYLETDLVSAKAIRNIQIDGPAVTVSVALGFPAKGHADYLAESVKSAVGGISGVGNVSVDVDWKVAAHAVQKGVETLKNIKNVIAVASGKGGVGKSTVSANLALALAAEGATVGMLDADIYGPSQPRMLGAGGQPESKDGKTLEPVVSHDVQSMSIGYLIEEDTPMIWRGPMVQSALEQMMRDVNWGELDVLIVDMPPGTGDAQLTMAQRVPLTGAVVVSTPQDIALLDARKGLNMFRKVDVPVFGIIENMSYFSCPHCGERSEIFSHGGARAEAELLSMDFLGEIPLAIDIRETSDGGQPIVTSQPDSEHAKAYKAIAETVWNKTITAKEKGTSAAPNIVIQ